MTFRVETLSTQIIKPSSQTPSHLRDHKLSYLDQILIPVYSPIIFFYGAEESITLTPSYQSQISEHLKQSLSNTLTLFYPLAGRIKSGGFSIDCNDGGIEFIEARTHLRLTEVVHTPFVKDLKQFLPRDPSDFNGTLVLVKVTFFECGGFSIGLCVSHKFADGVSIMAFVNAWAATSRGVPNISGYSFDLATFFPPRDNLVSVSWTFADDEDMAKCFVFDKQMLAALKHADTSPHVSNPTRVEAVSAFIWKNFIEVTLTKNPNTKGVFFASQAMNLRSRATSPLHLENVFGNCYIAPISFYKPDCDMVHNNLYHELVKRFRDSIQKIDGDFIREAQIGDSFFHLMSKFVDLYKKGELREGCAFTSWSRFPIYEMDFGWGNPTRVGAPMSVKNSVLLMDTRNGEGIEAWVNMDRDVVEMLDKQIQLIR